MLCSTQGRFGDGGDAVASVASVEVVKVGPWTVHPEVVINTQQRGRRVGTDDG